MELAISMLSLGISIVSLLFVYQQLTVAAKTTRATLMNDLVSVINFDEGLQHVLHSIYRESLSVSKSDDQFERTVTFKSKFDSKPVTKEVDDLLSRFDMIGHLYNLSVLKRVDLKDIRYEVIMVGRNQTIRKYLQFLNTGYQQITGVSHDHYEFFKDLYLEFEYDTKYSQSFQKYLIKLPKHIKK